MTLFPYLISFISVSSVWVMAQSPFSHCQIRHCIFISFFFFCQIRHCIFNLSKISVLHRKKKNASVGLFKHQSWELAVGSLFRASHKAGGPSFSWTSWWVWESRNERTSEMNTTVLHKSGRRICCLRSNLGRLEQGEESRRRCRRHITLWYAVWFFSLTPRSSTRFVWLGICETQKKEKAECCPGSLWHRTVATNAKETDEWLRALDSKRSFRD